MATNQFSDGKKHNKIKILYTKLVVASPFGVSYTKLMQIAQFYNIRTLSLEMPPMKEFQIEIVIAHQTRSDQRRRTRETERERALNVKLVYSRVQHMYLIILVKLNDMHIYRYCVIHIYISQ